MRKIADGGMGAVYEAHMKSAAEAPSAVAVKMLQPELSSQPQYMGLFLREAALARRLVHPNIVRTYDSGISETGLWMILELVRGVSLGHLMQRQKARLCTITLELGCFIGAEVCRGLHYAHLQEAGPPPRPAVMHRDICPNNLLLSWQGEVKISDFGIARQAGERWQALAATGLGRIGYGPPERHAGLQDDRRGDLFALSVVLFELLTGFDLAAERRRHLAEGRAGEPEVPSARALRPELPEPIEELLLRGRSLDPRLRHQSAAELLGEIEAAVDCSDAAGLRASLSKHLHYLFPELFGR